MVSSLAPMPKLLGLHAIPPAQVANGGETSLQKESPSGGQGFRGAGPRGGSGGREAPAREDNPLLGVLFRAARDFCCRRNAVRRRLAVTVETSLSTPCRGFPIQLASALPQRLPVRPSQDKAYRDCVRHGWSQAPVSFRSPACSNAGRLTLFGYSIPGCFPRRQFLASRSSRVHRLWLRTRVS
jgi:hypothetical protein